MGAKRKAVPRGEPLSSAELKEKVHEIVRDRFAIKASALKTALKKLVTPAMLDQALDVLRDEAREGHVARWQKGKTEWFFAQEPAALLDHRVQELLKGGPQSIEYIAVQTRLPKDYVTEWKKSSVAAGRLFEVAALPGQRAKRLALFPDLRPTLAKSLKATKNTISKLREQGVADESIAEALLAELGLRAAVTSEINAPSTDTALVFSALKALASEGRAGALLPVADLRKRASLSKERFDRAALALRDEGLVVLHYHDHPGALTIEERAQLVLDAHGNHYIGIALDPT